MPIKFPEYDSFDGIGLANLIQRGVLSPTEVLDAAIERIEFWNPMLNAVIHKMYNEARAAIKSGLPEGPFKGVPILLKDLLGDYAGQLMSFGSRYAHDNHFVSPQNSEVVNRLIKSGAVILGKTNVPEFGLSPVTEPALYGPTRNPWNLEYTPGGSSGGSAAAVAARMVPIAHGGDGGGSLRMPAAYTGVFGFKPTRGRTPCGPIFMRIWLGFVVEHVLSRSVRDSAAMLDVLCGPETGSPISLPKPEKSFLHQLDKSLPKLKIGWIDQPFFAATVDPEYKSALKKAGLLCQHLGHEVERTGLSFNDDIAFAFLIIMISETAAGLSELTKVIGRKPRAHELESATAMLCHMGKELSAADYSWAIATVDRVAVQLAELFKKYDVLLTPTLPFPAPKIGEHKLTVNEQIAIKLLRYMPFGQSLRQFIQRAAAYHFSFMSFTALFNICGQPAMSVPLYWDKNEMPIGIQFAAKVGDDALLLQFARQLEEVQPWSRRRPQEKVEEQFLEPVMSEM